MNKYMKLLRAFLNNPSRKTLNEFQASLPHKCVVQTLMGGPNMSGRSCRKCPISYSNTGMNGLGICLSMVESRLKPRSDEELGQIVAPLLRFKVYLEVLKEKEHEFPSKETQ
jgi:hypothetical protein